MNIRVVKKEDGSCALVATYESTMGNGLYTNIYSAEIHEGLKALARLLETRL